MTTTQTTRGIVLHVEDTSILGIDAPWWPRLSYQPQRVLQHQNVGIARGCPLDPPLSSDTQPPNNPLSSVFDKAHRVQLEWSPTKLITPSLTWRTTFLACALPYLHIPALPPGWAVHTATDRLDGYCDVTSGVIELQYDARYTFVAPWLYTSPPLLVCTTLTTETAHVGGSRMQGRRMDEQGRARLVGVAGIQRTGAWLCDTLVGLPTTCRSCLDVCLCLTT